ncbi:MAG TPA: MFS transporter [Steroidobacteraceae bacterium]|jgi:SHS family lactate transporter-like MFS transporter|nr:MFS transporter [Steroidobacteraceae bacterium]
MALLNALKGWTPAQKSVVTASFLGWALDAFDFFLLVFVLKDVASEFGVEKKQVAVAIMLTLACRPLGAFIFGRLADRFGRRPVLMLDVGLYSLLGLATAFAPNLTMFLVIRALFGIAMGGEWGIGASLTMESVKPEARGVVSGLLQSGYPTGYLLASVVYAALYNTIGWRGMFMVGALPALLVLYIRRNVPESPAWNAERARTGIVTVLRKHWRVAVYGILLMTAFNFFSHGTQDIYPTFLQVQHGFNAHETGIIAIIYNCGAILGGWIFGTWSQASGRRRTIMIAAALSLPVAYLWAYSTTMTGLAVGAFLMQVCVQGAWGVIPAHLNEISPPDARATFPGTIYQLGNLIASSNAVLQTTIAENHGENYAFALASVAVAAAVAIATLAAIGREARDVKFS